MPTEVALSSNQAAKRHRTYR